MRFLCFVTDVLTKLCPSSPASAGALEHAWEMFLKTGRLTKDNFDTAVEHRAFATRSKFNSVDTASSGSKRGLLSGRRQLTAL
jgi:hypothetical protein